MGRVCLPRRGRVSRPRWVDAAVPPVSWRTDPYMNGNILKTGASIRVAQRKRGGPITHRSQDRNLALI